jgi:hypothetical protein
MLKENKKIELPKSIEIEGQIYGGSRDEAKIDQQTDQIKSMLYEKKEEKTDIIQDGDNDND